MTEYNGANFQSGKKNNYKRLLKRFIVVSFLIIALGGYGVYWAFFDMNGLPTGEYLTSFVIVATTLSLCTTMEQNPTMLQGVSVAR